MKVLVNNPKLCLILYPKTAKHFDNIIDFVKKNKSMIGEGFYSEEENGKTS